MMDVSNDCRVIKCVVVGDGAVGKRSMLISYVEGKFPDVPACFDTYTTGAVVNGCQVKMGLFETSG